MTEPITLTKDELEDITGRCRPSAQKRWLAERYGIHAEPRPDGSLSVPRALYYQKAGIKTERKPELRI